MQNGIFRDVDIQRIIDHLEKRKAGMIRVYFSNQWYFDEGHNNYLIYFEAGCRTTWETITTEKSIKKVMEDFVNYAAEEGMEIINSLISEDRVEVLIKK